MIDMAVAVDDGTDGPVAPVPPVERETGCRRLARDERVDDDDPGVALDDRHVRQVEPAHLVDALDDLEEPLLRHELRLPPQARVHRRRCLAGQEAVAVGVPHDPSLDVPDDSWLQRAEEAAVGVGEVRVVVPGQAPERRCVGGDGGGGGRLRSHERLLRCRAGTGERHDASSAHHLPWVDRRTRQQRLYVADSNGVVTQGEKPRPSVSGFRSTGYGGRPTCAGRSRTSPTPPGLTAQEETR